MSATPKCQRIGGCLLDLGHNECCCQTGTCDHQEETYPKDDLAGAIGGFIDGLKTENATLNARVAELEKDKERLDWLDAQGMGQEPRVWSVYQFASNIRQAIDATKGDSK